MPVLDCVWAGRSRRRAHRHQLAHATLDDALDQIAVGDPSLLAGCVVGTTAKEMLFAESFQTVAPTDHDHGRRYGAVAVQVAQEGPAKITQLPRSNTRPRGDPILEVLDRSDWAVAPSTRKQEAGGPTGRQTLNKLPSPTGEEDPVVHSRPRAWQRPPTIEPEILPTSRKHLAGSRTGQHHQLHRRCVGMGDLLAGFPNRPQLVEVQHPRSTARSSPSVSCPHRSTSPDPS